MYIIGKVAYMYLDRSLREFYTKFANLVTQANLLKALDTVGNTNTQNNLV